jgi:hypothetical protein
VRIKLPVADQLRVNEPLPWNLLDGAGMLLLTKGTVLTDPRRISAILERGAYVDREEYESSLPSPAAPPPPTPLSAQENPFQRWQNIHAALSGLLRHQQSERQFADRLASVSADIRQLVAHDTDAAIFAMTRIDKANYAVAHSLQTAVACEIYGRFLRWHEGERTSLVHAALTMNVAMLDLQQTLAQQREPPTPEQREEIKRHPERGYRQLCELGISDQCWLQAVLQHHEAPDGTGYPAGSTAIVPSAEVLNVADRYCALMSSRRSRQAMLANEAARELYLVASGSLQEIIARMIKAFGLYPPGNMVKLASGETAVVMRRGEHANKPLVCSMLGERGARLPEPVQRDTAHRDHAIVQVLPDDLLALSFDPARLFGY